MRPSFLALLIALSPGAAVAAPGDVHQVINAATLRDAPSGTEIGTVSARNPVPLVERSRQGGWIETDRGWVWGALLSPGTSGDPLAPGPATAPSSEATVPAYGAPAGGGRSSNRMVVSVYATDLRQAPKSDARADLRLSEGSEVSVSRTEGEWAYVSYGDAKGWTLRAHLKPSETPEPAAPVRPARLETVARPMPRMDPPPAPGMDPLPLRRPEPAAVPPSEPQAPPSPIGEPISLRPPARPGG